MRAPGRTSEGSTVSTEFRMRIAWRAWQRSEGSARGFFFSSRRRHTRFDCDWSSDVCSSDPEPQRDIVPGVARLDLTQAAAYFMLGETTGTSAGGKDEEGKFLRVPGTNPFFPRDMADMGNRMLELLDSHEVQAFVLNTGRVGGGDDQTGAKKVTIPYSSAIVQGIVEGTIEWTEDPDFGYEVAAAIPGVDDIEILQPRRLYERQGRTGQNETQGTRPKRGR